MVTGRIALSAKNAERLQAVRGEVEQLGVRAMAISTDARLLDNRSCLAEHHVARLRYPLCSLARHLRTYCQRLERPN
jgi:hypothetical protein